MTEHKHPSADTAQPAAWRWHKPGEVRWTLDFYPPSDPDIVKEPLYADPAPVLRALPQNSSADSDEANWARMGASEYACYRWPEDTAEHRAMRAAFMDGAAHAVSGLPQTTAHPDVEARIAVLSDALKSISKNTCCDNCQEAARVARSALRAYVRFARTAEGGNR